MFSLQKAAKPNHWNAANGANVETMHQIPGNMASVVSEDIILKVRSLEGCCFGLGKVEFFFDCFKYKIVFVATLLMLLYRMNPRLARPTGWQDVDNARKMPVTNPIPFSIDIIREKVMADSMARLNGAKNKTLPGVMQKNRADLYAKYSSLKNVHIKTFWIIFLLFT